MQMAATAIDTSNYEYLALTANYWAKASTIEGALRQLRHEAGSDRVKKFGYVLYHCHVDTEVNDIDGGLIFPKGKRPLQLEDKIVRKQK
jgi:hypothetical protein